MNKLKKLSKIEIGILILEILVLLVGVIITFIPFSEKWNFLPYIGIPCAVISLSMLLITFQIKEKHNNFENHLMEERQKGENLYGRIEKFSTEQELESIELAFGFKNKKISNKVIIISNNLIRETDGDWTDVVIENIKSNVSYTYFTTKSNLCHFIGILNKLKKENNHEWNKRLSIYLCDTYFEFMPSYSEIVIYDNKGIVDKDIKKRNARQCFVCFTHQPIDKDGKNLLYEDVTEYNTQYCDEIIPKIEELIKIATQDKTDNCIVCNHNSQWEKYNFEPIETKKQDIVFINPDGIELIYVKGSGVGIYAQKDFYIGKYLITQREWRKIMNENPSHFTGDDRPVENVSWNDIQIFIEKLNNLTNKKYRLPKEEEWIYAAKGGAFYTPNFDYKYAGSNNVYDVAWFDDNSNNQTHSVGKKKPNLLRIYDMSGNVWEWCDDFSDKSERYRILRGGSWAGLARDCRLTFSYYDNPDYKLNDMGFRLVLDV